MLTKEMVVGLFRDYEIVGYALYRGWIFKKNLYVLKYNSRDYSHISLEDFISKPYDYNCFIDRVVQAINLSGAFVICDTGWCVELYGKQDHRLIKQFDYFEEEDYLSVDEAREACISRVLKELGK